MSAATDLRRPASVFTPAAPAPEGLRCPACLGLLRAEPAELRCSGCDAAYACEAGVPRFGGADPRRHRLSEVERRQIARAAATEGWQVALHDLARGMGQSVYRQAADEYRAQWRFALSLSPRSRVLDLNCGWGAVALNLSELCASVTAADPCPSQALFTALRARQTRHENLTVVQLGLDRPLPFPDASFDAVVLVDGLGWLTSMEAQRLVVQRIHSALQSGGSLFLAERNRWGANFLAQAQGGGRTHTWSGYRKLLTAAGFRDFSLYAPIPSHEEPFFLVSLDSHPPLAYFIREILAGQNFEAHFRRRGQRLAYRLMRESVRRVPADWLAAAGRRLIPSLAIVAHA